MRTLFILAALSLSASAAHAQRAVFVVRHAEKASATEKDPVLSMSGEDRALNLTSFLRAIPVDAIFVTHLKRTQLTAQPLADLRSLKPTVLDAGDIPSLIKQIRALPKDAVVLVVGHSDTVPLILSALGVQQKITLRDDQFSRVFLVTPGADPGSASLLEFNY